MNYRKVTIGPYQLGALDAFDDVANMPELLKHMPPVNVKGIFYSNLIQSGNHVIEVAESGRDSLPDSNFIENRTTFFEYGQFAEKNDLIKETFKEFLPDDYEEDPKYSELSKLEYLLIDLLIGLEKESNLLTLFEIPEPTQFQEILPPELSTPIRNLLSTLEPINPTLPIPKVSVSTKNVEQFESIISSDIYSDYSSSHKNYEDVNNSPETALAKINSSSKIIYNKYVDRLKLKRLAISALPIGSKIIENVFGILPGALAKLFTKPVEGLLKSERRIIVYHMDLANEILRPRIKRIKELDQD